MDKKIFLIILVSFLFYGCDRPEYTPKEISRISYGDGYCILRDDRMVIIKVGDSVDMMPIELVSSDLALALTDKLNEE